MWNNESGTLTGDQVYTGFIEPFAKHASSSSNVDWATWSEKLPAPSHACATEPGRLHVEELCLHRGSLSIAEGLEIHKGGILVVLGDLHVVGGVVAASSGYLAIVVRGHITVDRLYVTGDVIALGGIKAELWWGRGNDYSTYTPRLEAGTYISQDRGDIIDTRSAQRTLEDADLAEHFKELDPTSDDSICEFLGLVRIAIPSAEAGTGDKALLEAKLKAAWQLPMRRERIKAMRTVYATIKRGRLANLGEALVGMIERKAMDDEDWSIQDELELLAVLRRADLLESLPTTWLGGSQGWIPNLLTRARE